MIEEVFNRAKNIRMDLVLSYGLFLQMDSKTHLPVLGTQFGIIGLHPGAVMMALCNADSGSVRKPSKLVESKLENTFLLPLLKQSRFSKPGQKLIKTAKKRVLAGYRTQDDKVLSIVSKDPSPMDGHLM